VAVDVEIDMDVPVDSLVLDAPVAVAVGKDVAVANALVEP
jgi:hypothetical protein